jgi:hypothetical protein
LRQHRLKAVARSARAEIVLPEPLVQFLVAVHDARAALHGLL